MATRADVTEWCCRDVAELVRRFARDWDGQSAPAAAAVELAERLCERIRLEVRMHLDRQAWLRQTAGRAWDGPAPDPAASAGFTDEIPY